MKPAMHHALHCALAIGLVLLLCSAIGYCTSAPALTAPTSTPGG